MIKLDRPIIVEGKYDKITLQNIIDGLIIPTNGFGIFKDKEKCDMIRRLSEKKGVIIMTDSDSAGAVIRSYLKKIVGNAEIINVYVPVISGKEKRKTHPSKEGTLGVEGMTPETIKAALLKSGVYPENCKEKAKITKTDLYFLGLSGGENSGELRRNFLKFLELPENLSPSAALDVFNNMFGLEELKEKFALWQKSTDKNLK